MYPNPTNKQFTLFLEGASKEKVQVEVFDMIGRLLKHIESNDGQAIEFGEELPTGAYFTVVCQGTYPKTVRLIKKKTFSKIIKSKPSQSKLRWLLGFITLSTLLF